MTVRIIVSAEEAGQRVDQVLCARFGVSRAQARRLVASGKVRHGGRRALKGDSVSEGAELELDPEALELAAQPDATLPLVIRFEDDELLVLDKPVGVPSHPLNEGERGCIANALVARYPDMIHVGYDARQAGLVNRLDNDTSGLLLAAKTRQSFELLRAMLRRGEIHKRYLALTYAPVPLGEVRLVLEPRGPKVRVAAHGTDHGRETVTHILSCQKLPSGFHLIEVEASRAYRHQVRVHLAHLGAPLVGDVLYGGEPAAHHHLHAAHLAFIHPFTARRVEVTSPLPSDWPTRSDQTSP